MARDLQEARRIPATTTSSLHATGSVAAHQVLDFSDGNSVEIARYRMFQAARGNGKFEGLLPVFIGVQAIDQCGREAVTTANAVNDVSDLVTPR